VLWKKVKPALSAGRVQSVAVRLIVEREREIEDFETEASYRVTAIFDKEGQTVKAELNCRLKTKEEVLALMQQLKAATFRIEDRNTRPAKKSPAPPFTTSTLQQEAARKLGFSVSQTMTVAQRLYESGKITYMRTDSVNLSQLALNTSKETIVHNYGERYSKTRQYATKTKGAQEAHEAIRPTFVADSEINGTEQEKRLYQLIWKRTVASQMADAELEKTTVSIDFGDDKRKFVAEGEVLLFDGFLRLYLEGKDDEDKDSETGEAALPPLSVDDILLPKQITAAERFSQRPFRFTEASLVRKLEELGIGRPSTYAPTISTIQNREYVVKGSVEGTERSYNQIELVDGIITDKMKTETYGADKNKLLPTDIGRVVNDYLTENFPQILDYNFTANIEKEFDDVAEGKAEWRQLIDSFYRQFHPTVEKAESAQTAHKVGERILGTDPKTGEPVSVKIGRYGPIVQIGSADREDKPRFASLQKDQSISTITLEEALQLFALPRNLGLYNGEEVVIGTGRFGPYIRYNSAFVSLPKGYDPYTVSLEQAIVLVQDKQKKDSEKIIKTFAEKPDLQVLNGRYGPYISYQKNNYKLPKGSNPSELTVARCMEIIEKAPAKTGKKKFQRSGKK
jgi:DNA topoisomerase-1